MGLRIQAYLVSVLTALAAAYASALGLGEIKLNSALNQPLDAEIKLLQVRDLTEKEIIVGLASKEEFDRLGIDRPHYLTDLSFSVDLDTPDGPVVKVTSLKPIREPFLDFIVQAQWPSGRLLREYTLLIDLPVFSGDQETAPARSTETPARQTQPQPAAREAQPQAPAQTAEPRTQTGQRPPETTDGAGVEEYGPVAPNESLWSIASRARPDSSVSVQQTMLAIQRMNPQAFINENINLLRRGEVLRIPGKEDIQSLSSREAISMVAEQNRLWNEQRAPAGRAQLQGSRTEQAAPQVTPEPEGRVKLVTPPTADTEAAQGSGDADTARAALEAELAVAQEQFDAARRERSELRSRRTAMDDQIDTIEKLLAVSSEELRDLELAAQQMNENRQIASDSGEATPSTPEVAGGPEPAQQAPAQQQPEPSQPVAPAAPERSLVDLLLDNLLYILIGLGVIAAAVGAFFYIRHQNSGFDEDEDLDELPADFTRMNLEDAEDADIREDDKTVIAPFMSNRSGQDGDEEVVDAPEEAELEAETEDVVAESDIHIAYGQFDQAEEKLTKALAREPGNAAARLKLLEVYAAQQNGEKFDQEFARLRVIGGRDTLERAETLRESISGVGPFDEGRYDVSGLRAAVAGGSGIAAGAAAADVLQEDERAQTDSDDLAFNESLELDLPESSDQKDFDESLELDLDELEDDDTTVVGFARGGSDIDDTEFDLGEDVEQDSELDLELDDADLLTSSTDEQSDLQELGPEFDLDSVEFDLDEDLSGALDESADRGSLAEKVSVESGAEGLVLEDDHDFDPNSSTPFSLGLEETDVAAEDVTEVEQDEFSADLGDDFNLDDLDQDLDDLAGSFDGDFTDLDEPANEDTIEPLGTFAEDFADLDIDDDALSDEDSDLEAAFLSEDSEEEVADAGEVEIAPKSNVAEFQLPEFDPNEDDDTNLGFLSDSDETATKLDLARAYIDMGDADGAKDILDEILEEGDSDQKKEAETLMAKLG